MVVTRRKRQETPHCIQNTKTAKCSQKGCMMKAHTSRTTVWAKRSDPGVDAGPLVHEGGSERGRGPHRPEVRPPTADPERGLPLPHGPGGGLERGASSSGKAAPPTGYCIPPEVGFFCLLACLLPQKRPFSSDIYLVRTQLRTRTPPPRGLQRHIF